MPYKNCYAILVIIVSIILIISSCSENHSKHWDKITAVEFYIEEHPDSALTVLQNIPAEDLHNTEERAKYALLLSMALDKNVIDTTNFNVLQPAIDYYSRNGSATDKLRMYYYKGRIHENAGDDDLAMESMVMALAEGKESTDILTKARALAIQGDIYYSLYEWEKSKKAYIECVEYFKEANRINSYINNIISVIDICIVSKTPKEAEKYISEVKTLLHKCSESRKTYFYSVYLSYTTNYGTDEQIKFLIQEYLSAVSHRSIDWLAVAQAYIKLKDYTKSINALSRFKGNALYDGKVRYYALLSEAYTLGKEHEKSNKAYQQYIRLKGASNYKKQTQETQFIEEKFNLRQEKAKEKRSKYHILIYASIIGIVFIFVFIFIRYKLLIRTRENESFKLQYYNLVQEKEYLTQLLEKNKELNDSTQAILQDRISILNKFFTSCIIGNIDIMKTLGKEVKDTIKNRDKFINSTRMAFTASHPLFIKYLQNCNLSIDEINYCCMYAIGLNGKEVGNYLGLKSNYIHSSRIRKKLGMGEHDTNLGLYIRQILSKNSV